MANRFWVGNGGNWSDNINHWSSTTGGSPGASLPTSADNVFFDVNSFTLSGQTVIVDGTHFCLGLDWTNATNNPIFTANTTGILSIYDNCTFISNMTVISTYLDLAFRSFSVGRVFTTANKQFHNVRFNRASSSWILVGNLNVSDSVFIQAGTFDSDIYDVNVGGSFISNVLSSRVINMGSGTYNISGNFTIVGGSLTINKESSTIKMLSDSTTFDGAGFTYNNIELQGNNITIIGDNTFNDLKGVAGKTTKITAGSTQTVISLSGAGTSSNFYNIKSTVDGSRYYLSSTTNQNVNYWSIQDSTAQGGGIFTANDSQNISNNINWIFSPINVDSISIISSSRLIIPLISLGSNVEVIPITSNSDVIIPEVVLYVEVFSIPIISSSDVIIPTIRIGVNINAISITSNSDVIIPIIITDVVNIYVVPITSISTLISSGIIISTGTHYIATGYLIERKPTLSITERKPVLNLIERKPILSVER